MLVFRQQKNAVKTLRDNLSFVVISSIFVFGLLAGSFSIGVCENEDFYGLRSYFDEYITFVKESNFSDLFLNSLFVFSLLILLNYIRGLCVIGNFISIFMLLVFSFGVGSVSGFLYRAFSIYGIGFFALTVMPGLFLFCINYLVSQKHSFEFSKKLFKLCKSENKVSVDFRIYSIKFVIHFILVIIVSLVFAFFSNTFSDMFDFS